MTELTDQLLDINNNLEANKNREVGAILTVAHSFGLKDVEVNTEKPWGAYIRFDNENAGPFIREFFPGLSMKEAKLGVESAELSPKILLVSPGERLSLQKHARRAERWCFLTDGAYYKSKDDDNPGELKNAKAGEVVQFEKGEVHRLCGLDRDAVLVAEIWQHVDQDNPSNEDDIMRLQDDYSR